MHLLLATTNRHKFEELADILSTIDSLVLLSLIDFPHYIQPAETGQTFADNAYLKAKDAARTLSLWTLADDSGLVVPRLDGAPGVLSARYAGPKASALENQHKLLEAMRGFKDNERSAYFECALALFGPENETYQVQKRVYGYITDAPRADRGFGYSSLFVVEGTQKTFAEMSVREKNGLSHRSQALLEMVAILKRITQFSS